MTDNTKKTLKRATGQKRSDVDASEEKFRSLIENIPDVIWTSDENGNTPYISEGVTKIFGFTPDEIYNDPDLWFGRIHKDDVGRVKKAFEDLIETGALFDIEYRLQRKDGIWIWVHDRAAKTYRRDNLRYVDGMFRDITQHKMVEEALEQSEANYRSLFENSTIGIVVTGPDLLFQQVNAAFCKMLEYNEEELVGKKNIGEVTHPEDRHASKELLEKLIRKDIDHFVVEKRYVAKSGKIITALNFSRGIYDNSGHYINGTASIFNITERKRLEEELRNHRDHLEDLVRERTNELEVQNEKLSKEIAERKRVEEALRESESRLKDAQTLGRIGNWEFDVVTQKITWSDQTYRLYDRDPALGPPTAEEEAKYYTGEHLAKTREYARLAISTGKTFKYHVEAHLSTGNSTFFFVTMQPVKDAQGRVVKLFGTVQDITESRSAEERLRQMNQFLDSIIENIPLIITVKDARTLKYQRVNRTFEQQSKMVKTDIIGKTAYELFSPAEAESITAHDRMVIQGKRIQEFEGRTTRVGRIYRTTKMPLPNAEGVVEYLLSIAADVTEQKKIEQELEVLLEKALQISDLKTSLISQAAHELKTPLTAILGWGELFYNTKKQGKSLDETFDVEDIEAILRNAERLNDLTNDFLDVGRIESGKFELNKEKTDFNEIIENATRAVDYLATKRNIKILTQMEPGPPISIDPRRMEQVIVNLLSNAIKYSPEHTRVTIHTGHVKVDERKMFRVVVTDEGFGFTPEELAEAKTPFGKAYTQQDQKRAIQGTGLGLFICTRIVEQHGGTITIRSEGANKGTRVEVLLPTN